MATLTPKWSIHSQKAILRLIKPSIFKNFLCRPTMVAYFKAQPPSTEKILLTPLRLTILIINELFVVTTLLNLLPENTLNEENVVRRKSDAHKKSSKILQKLHNIFFTRYFFFVLRARLSFEISFSVVPLFLSQTC